MRSYSFTFLVLSLCCAIHLGAQTEYDLGRLPGSPLRMGFGARGIGMGNALSSIRTDESVSYYNPALVAFQMKRKLSIGSGLLSLDRKLNTLSYSQGIGKSAGIALGIVNTGVTNLEGRNRDGLLTESYSTSENSFFFSFGTQLSKSASLGLTTKILYYSLFEKVASTTVGFDIGLQYALNNEVTAAFVLQDLNSKYKWDTTPIYGRDGNTTIERFPLRRKMGISYSPHFANAVGSAEVEWIGTNSLVRIGFEASLHETFSLYCGIDQISFARSLDAKPAAGFSFLLPVEFWKPKLHYAYVIEPYAQSGIHLLSLSLTIE
ncbi:MAG: hypothetical protein V1799_07240 [bacterium]